MRLHLNNPIAIVICKTIYGKKLSEVRFVTIANRRKGLTQNLKGTIADKNRQNIAEKIAEILGIKFSVTTYDEFIEEDIDILDSTLVANNVKGKFDLVLQSSDAYCRLGFQSYFRFFAFKIHLFQYWRKIINYKKVKNLYIFNFPNNKYKFANGMHIIKGGWGDGKQHVDYFSQEYNNNRVEYYVRFGEFLDFLKTQPKPF